VLIELYFDEDPFLAQWRGANNSLGLDCPGVSLGIRFNEDYKTDYQRYIAKPSEVLAIPIEYYKIPVRFRVRPEF
jgi:putative ATP-dependent endonuclease of the OLD family